MKAKRLLAFAMAGAMIIGTCTTAFADDSAAATEYVNLGGCQTARTTTDSNYGKVTATAHRAAAPLVDMLGANLTSGYGIINGGAPTGSNAENVLADANTRLALKVWGTGKNTQPDPYFANYYFDFYADVMGYSHAGYAMINDNRAGSPIQADPQATSLSTRPQVVIGVSSTANGVNDDTGYDGQLEDINYGLEETDPNYYSPCLVKYNPTSLDTMIATVYSAADAIYHAGAYRYENPNVIASEYENYIHGIQGYIRSRIAAESSPMTKKTVAIVKAYDTETRLFTAVSQGAVSTTSSDRLVEYTSKICNNITASAEESVSVSAVNSANWIISENAATDASIQALVDAGTITNNRILYSTDRPDTLYGITMNSVENAMGLALYAGFIYEDQDDLLNTYNLLKYFYLHFMHVDENEVDAVLKEALGALYNNKVVDNVIYDEDDIQDMLDSGESYYHD